MHNNAMLTTASTTRSNNKEAKAQYLPNNKLKALSKLAILTSDQGPKSQEEHQHKEHEQLLQAENKRGSYFALLGVLANITY